MKTLLHTRNNPVPLGTSANLREVPSSVLPGSVITPGSARGLPFPQNRPGAIPVHAEFWRYPGDRTLGANAA